MVSLNFPVPVRDERDSYGYTELFARLKGVLPARILAGDHTPLVIVGERRSGKTSALNLLIRALPLETDCIAHILPAKADVEQFQIELLDTLCGIAGWRLEDKGWVQPSGERRRLNLVSTREFVEACSLAFQAFGNRPVIVGFDEVDSAIEVLLREDPAQARELLILIRHLLENTNLRLYWIFTLTQAGFLERAYESNFLHIAQLVQLNGFLSNETQTMATRLFAPQAQFSQAALDRLVELSGNHPYFAKAILLGLLDANDEPLVPVIERLTIDTATQAVINGDPGVASTVRNLLEAHFDDRERNVLYTMASRSDDAAGVSAAEWEDSLRNAALKLVERGYLKALDEEHFAFRILFLRDWLRTRERLKLQSYRQDEVVFYAQSRRLFVGGEDVPLTETEYKIAEYLFRRHDQVVSREELLFAGWGRNFTHEPFDDRLNNNNIDQIMRSLRKKLRDDPNEYKYIVVRPKIGFMAQHVRYLADR